MPKVEVQLYIQAETRNTDMLKRNINNAKMKFRLDIQAETFEPLY